MNGLFKDTLAELFDKKTVYLFFVITFLSILMTLFSGSFEMTINGVDQGLGIDELGIDVDTPLLKGIASLMSLLTFLAVMLSAGIIPNMFIKGRADYFLAKPLSRSSLLLKKFLSVWVVYGLLITLCGFSCYLVGALVHSVFNNLIFLLIGAVFVKLFIWLSISFFVGIFTGKTVSTIMFLFLTWMIQSGLSMLYSTQMVAGFGYEAFGKFLDYCYYLLPKMSEMSTLVDKVAFLSGSFNSYILYSTVGFAFAMLYFTLALFKRKNY